MIFEAKGGKMSFIRKRKVPLIICIIYGIILIVVTVGFIENRDMELAAIGLGIYSMPWWLLFEPNEQSDISFIITCYLFAAINMIIIFVVYDVIGKWSRR